MALDQNGFMEFLESASVILIAIYSRRRKPETDDEEENGEDLYKIKRLKIKPKIIMSTYSFYVQTALAAFKLKWTFWRSQLHHFGSACRLLFIEIGYKAVCKTDRSFVLKRFHDSVHLIHANPRCRPIVGSWCILTTFAYIVVNSILFILNISSNVITMKKSYSYPLTVEMLMINEFVVIWMMKPEQAKYVNDIELKDYNILTGFKWNQITFKVRLISDSKLKLTRVPF